MKIIGHRGAKGLAPENTLAGLRKALEHHVDEIEFDVRVTKDNIAILLHDEALTDVSGDQLLVKANSYAELKKHKPDLTLFSEVFAKLPQKTKLYIEVKPDEPLKPIIKVLRQALDTGWKPEQLTLGSFSQPVLRELRAEFPTLALSVNEDWSGVRAQLRARQVHAKRIQMDHRWLWSGFLIGIRRTGYQFVPYTMNDPAKVKRWEKYGIYGIITDYPDRFEKSKKS